MILGLVNEAVAAGALQRAACMVLKIASPVVHVGPSMSESAENGLFRAS
jgi:hypothetical protein